MLQIPPGNLNMEIVDTMNPAGGNERYEICFGDTDCVDYNVQIFSPTVFETVEVYTSSSSTTSSDILESIDSIEGIVTNGSSIVDGIGLDGSSSGFDSSISSMMEDIDFCEEVITCSSGDFERDPFFGNLEDSSSSKGLNVASQFQTSNMEFHSLDISASNDNNPTNSISTDADFNQDLAESPRKFEQDAYFANLDTSLRKERDVGGGNHPTTVSSESSANCTTLDDEEDVYANKDAKLRGRRTKSRKCLEKRKSEDNNFSDYYKRVLRTRKPCLVPTTTVPATSFSFSSSSSQSSQNVTQSLSSSPSNVNKKSGRSVNTSGNPPKIDKSVASNSQKKKKHLENICAEENNNLSWLIDFKVSTIFNPTENNVKNNKSNETQRKPRFTYTELIEQALKENGELTVSGIYSWISELDKLCRIFERVTTLVPYQVDPLYQMMGSYDVKESSYILCETFPAHKTTKRTHYPYFQKNDDKWKNSVRHNLSINPQFRKGKKASQGAGHYWTISESVTKLREASLAQKEQGQRDIETASIVLDVVDQLDEEVLAATRSIRDSETDLELNDVNLQQAAEDVLLSGFDDPVSVQYVQNDIVENGNKDDDVDTFWNSIQSVDSRYESLSPLLRDIVAEATSDMDTMELRDIVAEATSEMDAMDNDNYLIQDIHNSICLGDEFFNEFNSSCYSLATI